MIVDRWWPAAAEDVEWLAVLAEAGPTLDDLAARMPTFAWSELLHPAYHVTDGGRVDEVTWADVAASRGSDVLAADHFDALVNLPITAFENGFDDPTDVWNEPPAQGSLPLRQHGALLPVLGAREGGVCGVWAGWAAARRLATGGLGRVVAGREIVFFRSPPEGLAASADEIAHQAANVTFPLDRRWIVITDPDHWKSYVGADAATITALDESPVFDMRGVASRPTAGSGTAGNGSPLSTQDRR
ncbi:MAG: hypothetical protein ACRDQ0_03300 [Pseudonocardia sp.]